MEETSQEPGKILPLYNDEPTKDYGHALVLSQHLTGRLLWVDELRSWFSWSGRNWARIAEEEVEKMSSDILRTEYLIRLSHVRTRDESRAVGQLHAEACRHSCVSAALAFLKGWPEIKFRASDFDKDQYLFNCLNGTIDLRTGNLLPHRPEDYITNLAPEEYDPQAKNEVWEDYIRQVTGNDQEFLDYVQKAAGYSLTGSVQEEDVFFLLGPAGSGKTTLMEALLAVWGSYGHKASFTTFLARSSLTGEGDPPRADLLELRGKRLAIASEPEKGRRLAIALVKEASGGDSIRARAPHATFSVTFEPTHKLWLVANQAPEMDDEDSGLWRRIKNLPFRLALPEEAQDERLKQYLKEEARTAILAWAVEGCLKWQQEGLRPPKAVREETTLLRASFDPLGEFLENECQLDRQAYSSLNDLRDAYVSWARKYGVKMINDQEWSKRLEERGCSRDMIRLSERRIRVWRGIKLQP